MRGPDHREKRTGGGELCKADATCVGWAGSAQHLEINWFVPDGLSECFPRLDRLLYPFRCEAMLIV